MSRVQPWRLVWARCGDGEHIGCLAPSKNTGAKSRELQLCSPAPALSMRANSSRAAILKCVAISNGIAGTPPFKPPQQSNFPRILERRVNERAEISTRLLFRRSWRLRSWPDSGTCCDHRRVLLVVDHKDLAGSRGGLIFLTAVRHTIQNDRSLLACTRGQFRCKRSSRRHCQRLLVRSGPLAAVAIGRFRPVPLASMGLTPRE